MIELLKDIWGFLRVRKKLWLAPMIVMLLLLGLIIMLGSSSAIAPFVYALF